jgi:hypothetical protein
MSALLNGKQIKSGTMPISAIKGADLVNVTGDVTEENNGKLVTVAALTGYVAEQVATVNTVEELTDVLFVDEGPSFGDALIWTDTAGGNKWVNTNLDSIYVTQTELDNALATVDITQPVVAASTSNIAIGENGADKYILATGTFDGVALGVGGLNGQRVLFAGQTTASENGIYVMNTASNIDIGGVPTAVRVITRATDADDGSELPSGKTVIVMGVTGETADQENYLKTFILTQDVEEVGTDAQVWVKPRDMDLSGMAVLSSTQLMTQDRLLVWDQSASVNKATTVQHLFESVVDTTQGAWGLDAAPGFGRLVFTVNRDVTEVSNVDITDYLDHNEAAFAADSDIGTLVGFNTGITVNYDGEGAILASVQVFVNGILATESIDGTPLDGDYFWGTSIEGTEDNPNGNAYAYTAIGVSTQDTGVLVEGVVQKIAGNYNTASLNNTDVLYWNGDKYPLSDGDKITIVYKKQ